jgi:zinc protease
MSRILRPGLALPLVAVFAIAPLAATTPAGQTSAALPAARTIIDRHIKEIGGRAVILAQTSTHATGTVSLPAAGLTGKLEAFHAKPDKFVQRMSLPGIGDIEEGFDGKVGWSISPLTGPTLLDGKQLEQRKFDADFFEDLKASDRYASITTVEKTTFEGRPVYKIRLLKKAGDEDLELYDSETGLKVGAISTRDSPMGPMQTTTAWSDYRKFGSLLQPATTKVSVMSTQMILSITGVEYGTVDPSVFTVPAQIKALVK